MPEQSGIEALRAAPGRRPRRKGARALDAGRSRATCARRSRPARSATCSRRRPTPRSSLPCARSPQAAATSTPRSGPDLSRRRRSEIAEAEDDPLSEREREVLRLLALGHTNQEIAKMLYHLRANGRDAPGAHHAEAPPHDPCRARPLRDRERPARRGARAALNSSPRDTSGACPRTRPERTIRRPAAPPLARESTCPRKTRPGPVPGPGHLGHRAGLRPPRHSWGGRNRSVS